MASHALRRALTRAERGQTLNHDEAVTLLGARGEELDALCRSAARVRDRAFGRRVTYSRKVFVPLTHLCRDTCGYCTFAWPPKGDVPAYLSPEQVLEIARAGAAVGCKEALFTLGDKPEERYPAARAWLQARGYDSTLAYLRAVAIVVIEQTGLLPHLNPGVLTWSDLVNLKPVAASMGMMLESTSARLLDRGGAHFGAPDKDPRVRLRVLEDAGRTAVPFTSGILVGIGETHGERVEALTALAASARRYGHLQEVIVQPFRAKHGTAMRDHPEPDVDELRATLAVARLLLPVKVHLQSPPNLEDVDPLLDAGIDDLGGVSPVTPDHVNPEKPWPHLGALARRLEASGYELVERLAIYPEWARRPDPWLAGRMRAPVQALATPEGLAAARPPEPQPWQDPPLEVTAAAGPDRQGLRVDADDVYGDTALIAAERVRRRSRINGDVRAILAAAERGTPPSESDAMVLLEASGPDLDALCRAADAVRAERVGEVVTYVVNRNINFTNVCYVGCRFCAFAQRREDPQAITLTLEEVADRAAEAWEAGATEVCMQGGIHPDLPADHYFRLVEAVKARVSAIHVHAFSPMEVATGAARLGVPIREWLTRARDAGLDTIPGTAAEILDDDIRWVLTKGKLPAATWVEVIRTAHDLGIPSTSTMMFGHVDEPRHWAAHLWLLRRLQEETGGFTEFVPLPFVHQQAPIYLAGVARPGPGFADSLRVHAVARLVLQGAIDNIQMSWVKLGLERAVELLRAGVNDLGGTLMEESISRMAGADHGTRQDPEALRAVAAAAGRPAAQRTTTYGRPAAA